MKRKRRLAVLGTGWWANFQIAAWRRMSEQVELVALYNRTIAKAEKLAAKYGVPKVYGDPEELVGAEKPDLIDIIADVPAHAPFVHLAARHGIPVICQKPMGPDYLTCRGMVRACAEAGVPFFIHENFRWMPAMRRLKEVLAKADLGRVIRADIQLGTGGADSLEFQPSLATLNHYALTDMGSHVFDLARFLIGEPDRVYCLTARNLAGLAGEDTFAALLKINGILCTCQISVRMTTQIYIEGTRGAVELTNDNTLVISTVDGISREESVVGPPVTWLPGEAVAPSMVPAMNAVLSCNRHLLEALAGAVRCETTGEANLKTMEVMFAAIESAETEREVRVGVR